MKKILVFEDRARTANQIKDYFYNLGYDITICTTCSKVVSTVNEINFDIYIIDLNVAAIGLSEEQITKTQNGLRTGWVLLVDILLPKDPMCIKKTVIFSDYINKFKEYIDSEQCSNQEKEWFETLCKNRSIVEKSEGFNMLKVAIQSKGEN